MQLIPTWLFTTNISQGRVFIYHDYFVWKNDVGLSSVSWMSQDHMILSLLIGVVVRFEGYMLIGTLL